MELFRNAKTIRLRSHHDKFLLADDDKEAVCQDRNGGSPRARWTVEYVKGEGVKLIRLKSCYGKYLFSTEDPFFMGVTGKKVVQSDPPRLDSSVEWEPIRDGMNLKFKTRYGNYLRANGGVPPWRNSITHDVPSRSHTQDWILWRIEILDVYPLEKEASPVKVQVKSPAVDEPDPEPFSPDMLRTPKEPGNTIPLSPLKNEGRVVNYNIVDDDGNVDHENTLTLNFKGHVLEDLKQALEEETGLQDIIVCSQNPLNGKLNPLRLALPPHHVKMHVFVVPSSSKGNHH
ncbi:hypothetical protein V2J09_012449 [Rumex salicifolius]